MALQRAITAIEEDHEGYIMQLPAVDMQQLISKSDEDGRQDIISLPVPPILRNMNSMLISCASQDRSLLHAAVSSGKTDLVQYLLSKGASPNTSDDEVALHQIARPHLYHTANLACIQHLDVTHMGVMLRGAPLMPAVQGHHLSLDKHDVPKIESPIAGVDPAHVGCECQQGASGEAAAGSFS